MWRFNCSDGCDRIGAEADLSRQQVWASSSTADRRSCRSPLARRFCRFIRMSRFGSPIDLVRRYIFFPTNRGCNRHSPRCRAQPGPNSVESRVGWSVSASQISDEDWGIGSGTIPEVLTGSPGDRRSNRKIKRNRRPRNFPSSDERWQLSWLGLTRSLWNGRENKLSRATRLPTH